MVVPLGRWGKRVALRTTMLRAVVATSRRRESGGAGWIKLAALILSGSGWRTIVKDSV